MEPELALALDRLAARRLEVGLDRELAALAGGQIGLEVVDPVLLVRPAPAAFQPLGIAVALHREGIGEPRIAERDHRLGEAHRDLAHVLCLALRRENARPVARPTRHLP